MAEGGRKTRTVEPGAYGKGVVSLSRAEPSSSPERFLATLREHGIPCADGFIVHLAGDDSGARLAEVLTRALADREEARVTPLMRTSEARERFERVHPVSVLRRGDDAEEFARGYLAALSSPSVVGASGVTRAAHRVRVVMVDVGRSGRVSSVDPVAGDPEIVVACVDGAEAAPWYIERRSARITTPGEGLDVPTAERLADLADRAQLRLGLPIELRWAERDQKPVVVDVRAITPKATFVEESYRRVALVEADEGTTAPLAIDALDRALRVGQEPSVEAAVRRVFARPYRRMDRDHTLGRGRRGPLAVVTVEAARVSAEAAPLFAEVAKFERALSSRLTRLDGAMLRDLTDSALLSALRERQRLVAEALLLLDRSRTTTRATLQVLERIVGPLPARAYPALAAPRTARERRRIDERLGRLAKRIVADVGSLDAFANTSLSAATRRRFDAQKASLGAVRPLGIDVLPDAIGASDATMLTAMRVARTAGDHEARERARRDAVRRLRATARTHGRVREGLASSLSVLLLQIARSKGRLSEALASSLLRLRRAAVELGQRLVERAVLDESTDAMFLNLAELSEALRNEPGAYAARVRLRREDDARWRTYDAPRRIGRG